MNRYLVEHRVSMFPYSDMLSGNNFDLTNAHFYDSIPYQYQVRTLALEPSSKRKQPRSLEPSLCYSSPYPKKVKHSPKYVRQK